MKRFIDLVAGVCLVFLMMTGIYIVSMSRMQKGEPRNFTALNKGQYADSYECWVGTVAFNVILSSSSEKMTDWGITNVDTQDVWYDFDSSVATHTVNSSPGSGIGYRTGANAKLKEGQFISVDGRFEKEVYFKCGNTTGVKLSVVILRRY